jgi:hypothetical protein
MIWDVQQVATSPIANVHITLCPRVHSLCPWTACPFPQLQQKPTMDRSWSTSLLRSPRSVRSRAGRKYARRALSKPRYCLALTRSSFSARLQLFAWKFEVRLACHPRDGI